jgi:hypothetical protein
MSQHFDANRESKLIEKQCAEILNHGDMFKTPDQQDKGAWTALNHELASIYSNPQEFRAVQKQIAADNASGNLPQGLARISFKEENGKEYLDFTNDKTTLG